MRKKRPDTLKQHLSEEDQLGPEGWHIPLPKVAYFDVQPVIAESEHGDQETIEWFRPPQSRLGSVTPPLLIRDGDAISRPSSPDLDDENVREYTSTPRPRSTGDMPLHTTEEDEFVFGPPIPHQPDDLPSGSYKDTLESPALRMPPPLPTLSAWDVDRPFYPTPEADEESFLDKRASSWSVGDDLEEVLRELRGERFGFQPDLSERQVCNLTIVLTIADVSSSHKTQARVLSP